MTPLERQAVGDVVGGGLALDRGIERDDDLAQPRPRATRATKRSMVEIVRADAVERRQRAAEHMVAGIDDAGALQRPEVGDILDHDDQGPRRGAGRAQIVQGSTRVDIAADRSRS